MRALSLGLLVIMWLPLAAHGDLDLRIAELDAELAVTPNDSDVLRRRAELHRQHEDWNAALADLDQAARLAPKPIDDAYARGCILRAAGRPEAALLDLNLCLIMQPTHVLAQIEAAGAAADSGDWATAATHWDTCWDRLNPLRPQQVLDSAHAHRLQPGGSPDAELIVLQSGLDRLGPLPVLITAAVDAALAAKDPRQALVYCRGARSQAKRPETWLAREAEILESMGDQQGAATCRAQAIAAIDGLPSTIREQPATIRLRQTLSAAGQ